MTIHNGNGSNGAAPVIAPPQPLLYPNGNGNQQTLADLQPHNIDAEEALCGALLIDPDAILGSDYLTQKDFYLLFNGWVYEAIKHLHSHRRPTDLVSISDELDRRGHLNDIGGPAHLTDLINQTPTSISAPYYARLIYRQSVRRDAIAKLADATAKVYAADCPDDPEEITGLIQSLLLELDGDRAGQNEAQPITAGLGRFYDRRIALENGDMSIGISTGLRDLDRYMTWERGTLCYLAGRPGMGKSGAALTFALHAARRGERTLIQSLEMPEGQNINRLVAMVGGVDSLKLKQPGSLNDAVTRKVIEATKELERLPIFIDSQGGLDISVIRNRALRHKARHGLDLLIIDHLGKIRVKGAKFGYEEVSRASAALLDLSKELNIPVLCLHQLSRKVEDRGNKRPNLADLRDSGKIEEDAHAVIFLYRDDYYHDDSDQPNVTEIIIAKNRDGWTGTVATYFQKTSTMLVDLEVHKAGFDWGNNG